MDNIFTEEEKEEIVSGFINRFLNNIEDLDPEISKIVDKYFWELV